MKKTKNFSIIFAVVFSICATTLSPMNVLAATNNYEAFQTRADIIEWRYKTENEKVYKRKYNYSKNKWLGNWIFVANVVEKSCFLIK